MKIVKQTHMNLHLPVVRTSTSPHPCSGGAVIIVAERGGGARQVHAAGRAALQSVRS